MEEGMKMAVSRRAMRFFCLFLIISLFCCAEDKPQRDMSESPYDWTWGQDGIHVLGSFMGQHLAFMSYDDMGCSLLSEIDATANEVTFSCGFRLNELPASGVKHFDTQDGVVDDGPLMLLPLRVLCYWYSQLSSILIFTLRNQERVFVYLSLI